jgi:hypothetical protein
VAPHAAQAMNDGQGGDEDGLHSSSVSFREWQ